MTERVSDKDLKQIAKKGVCYTREARLMAQELIERRKQEQQPPQEFHPMAGMYP